MSVACSLQCGVRRLPWSSFCLVFSCVQVKSEAHWGNYEKNRRWIWSPGSSWWREEMCKTKNARNPPLSSVGGRNSAPPIYNLGFANAQLVPPHPEAQCWMTCWQVVQDFRHSRKSILITVSSNNVTLGARGFKWMPLKVVQDFLHQQ